MEKNNLQPMTKLQALYFSGFCRMPFQFDTVLNFGFEGWIWVLIASVPDLCILLTFIIRVLVVVPCGGPKKSPRTSI